MNWREFLKRAGVLCTAAVLALLCQRGRCSRSRSSHRAGHVPLGYRQHLRRWPRRVAEGAKAVSGTSVALKRVGEVIGDDLLSADAVIVGSPVYGGSMSGQVKTFCDNWGPKFGLGTATGKMRNMVGAAFATGGSISSGKEVTMLTILVSMLSHQMIVIRGASATTGPDSPGIDAKEIAEARDLGKRVAEVAAFVKRGSS